MSSLTSPLGITGIILLIIGLLMLIIGVVFLIIESSTSKGWYVWTLLIGGIIFLLIGGILLAVALSRPESKKFIAQDDSGRMAKIKCRDSVCRVKSSYSNNSTCNLNDSDSSDTVIVKKRKSPVRTATIYSSDEE
jgi:hypothetical protein